MSTGGVARQGRSMVLLAGLWLPAIGDSSSVISRVLYAPLALQEMVLAVWLIVRGFRPAR